MQSNKYLWLAVLGIILFGLRFYYARNETVSFQENKQIIEGTIAAINLERDYSFSPAVGPKGLDLDNDKFQRGRMAPRVRISLKEYPDNIYEIKDYSYALHLNLVEPKTYTPNKREIKIGDSKVGVGGSEKYAVKPNVIGKKISLECIKKGWVEPDTRLTSRGVSIVKITPGDGKHLYRVSRVEIINTGNAQPLRSIR